MMDPIIQFSMYAGELERVLVPGVVSVGKNPENEVDIRAGADRSMYVYVPRSGCPHQKQTSVIYILRNDQSRESAESLLNELGINDLAEREHVLVLFPNPSEKGWNYNRVVGFDDDITFLLRCFATVKQSVGVGGFNGMLYYIGATSAASAMIWKLFENNPLDTSAMMIGAFPHGFKASAAEGAQQVAWLYEKNASAQEILGHVNGPIRLVEQGSARCYVNEDNSCVRYYTSEMGLTSEEVFRAWSQMFSGVRRWRNDVFGTYQPRIDFESRGFVAHVEDASLGIDEHSHTWYEYVPCCVMDSREAAPLVLYFHGVNCVGLYGAEQSGWADIADREHLMVVFPDATIENRWNEWDDPRLPSDVSFIRALIAHMDSVHPVDYSRIYISGFSMGSRFTNALACTYPELFAGAIACNSPNNALCNSLDEAVDQVMAVNRDSIVRDLVASDHRESSPTRDRAKRRLEHPIPMPFVQFVGLNDSAGFSKGCGWPVRSEKDGCWMETVRYWKQWNGINEDELLSDVSVTGFACDAEDTLGDDRRFIMQSWIDAKGREALYHLIAVKRMSHAVDLREIEIGWQIVKHWSRNADGSLSYIE